jgi:hypothetical protein
MVEGIPAFFAASRYGIEVLSIMAVLFAASTIATYVVLSVAAASGLQRLRLGVLEEHGEIVSGLFVALVRSGLWADVVLNCQRKLSVLHIPIVRHIGIASSGKSYRK